ncbi:protein trichome birefringence-like 2 [Salvia miltiorrhiza]|uniref:protein trichome birefringence-like 2 n=1 Tax=Salvia miltiorrhiza TaxID=226208 RepID=UPI0025ACAB62|nr:protein trichome birefringence-like 2 [Salvia miltiorrhiza]
MVSFFSTLSSMDLKKMAFSDQVLSSQRRKVVSPCSFGIVLFFIVLSALLFSVSSKGPFLQGLYNLGSRGNTSFVSWHNTTNSSVTPNLQFPLNETLDANVTASGKGADSVKSGGGEEGFETAPAGNQSVKFEDVSFILEGSVGLERGARNGSQPVGNAILVDDSGGRRESGALRVGDSVGNVKNESVSLKEDGELGEGDASEVSTAKSVEDEQSSCGSGVESLEGGHVGNCSSNGGLRHEGVNAPAPAPAPAASDRSYKNCDIFNGRWVRDNAEPYYPPGSCPYIDRDFDCHLNGRPDSEYIKWRWQPYDCDIPRFNVIDFLERLRGKKLVFVGDSLNRNMWESLVCILRHGVADKSRVYEISGKHEFKKKGFYAFRFEDYNCSVDFVSSPFLVKESSFNGKNGSVETLRLDLMDATTSMYHDADVLIFNTGHWWTHEKTSRGEGYYQEGDYVHPRLKVLEAFKRALATWARWVDKNIDPNKTEVVFRGYSVTHFRGGPWNAGGQCNNETEPIMKDAYLAKYPAKMRILEHVLKDAKTPVAYLNISRLTDYRKDGHPSVYRPDYEAAQRQVHAQDCSHWCLPGVPDTWNQLLYVSLLNTGKGSWGPSF